MRSLFILCIMAMVLSGCKVSDQRVLEHLGFTNTTTYDLVPGDTKEQEQLLIAVSIPQVDPQSETKREVLSSLSKTSKAARIALSRQTNRILVSGQLRNVLFGTNLAKNGIWEHIDTLIRDPSIGQHVKVTVVEGRAYDLITKDFTQHPLIGTYIDELLDKEADAHAFPEVNIYHFARDYLDDGIDPVAPIIASGKDHIWIRGIALFKGDKYVDQIEADQTLIFSGLRGRFRQGEISIDLPSGEGERKESIMFSSITGKRNLKVTRTADKAFRVVINVNMQGSVLEYIGEHDISNPQDQKVLEQKIETYFRQKADALVSRLQKHNVDSIGIGQHVRNSLSAAEWKHLHWDKTYPAVQVDIVPAIKIKDHGKLR